jgi:hypothetical protein
MEKYQRDVLKWGISFCESGTTCGVYLRDGKLIERVPQSTLHGSDTDISYGPHSFNIPLISHPVCKPCCDPSPPWEDHELTIEEYSGGK